LEKKKKTTERAPAYTLLVRLVRRREKRRQRGFTSGCLKIQEIEEECSSLPEIVSECCGGGMKNILFVATRCLGM